MLYETLSQPFILLILSSVGLFSGIIFDLKNILFYLFKKNKIINQILLFFSIFILFLIFYLINLIINYGEIRFFSIFIFFLAFSIERFFVKNFLANRIAKCYNNSKEKRDARRKKMVEKV